MTYTIITRPIQPKVRGRKKIELPSEVAEAVRKAVVTRDVEALIGVDDVSAGKALLGAIKARVRDGSFGGGLSVRGSVTESSAGKVVVVFSILDYKPHTKPRKPKVADTVAIDPALADGMFVDPPKLVAAPKRARRQPVSA